MAVSVSFSSWMYNKEDMKKLVAASKGYVFKMEMIVRVRQQCFSVRGLPISFMDRVWCLGRAS